MEYLDTLSGGTEITMAQNVLPIDCGHSTKLQTFNASFHKID